MSNIESTLSSVTDTETKDVSDSNLQKLPVGNDILHRLQQENVFCKNILNQVKKGNIIDRQLYLVRDKILKRYVLEGNNTYKTIVVPKALTAQILRMAHDELGHNGTHQTYTLLNRL